MTTPRRDGESESWTTRFHRYYLMAMGNNVREFHPEVVQAIRQDRLLDWSSYQVGATNPQRRTLRVLYLNATRLDARAGEAPGTGSPTTLASSAASRSVRTRRFRPAVPTPDSALQARTVMEFMALLRLIAGNSGVNRNQLARRAGLPTSSTYHLLDRTNAVLPTKGEQIAALCQASGLANHQVEHVLRLWVELRSGGDRPVRPGDAPVEDTAAASTVTTETETETETPGDALTVAEPVRAHLVLPDSARRLRRLRGLLLTLAVLLAAAIAWAVGATLLGPLSESRHGGFTSNTVVTAVTTTCLIAVSMAYLRHERRTSAVIDTIRPPGQRDPRVELFSGGR